MSSSTATSNAPDNNDDNASNRCRQFLVIARTGYRHFTEIVTMPQFLCFMGCVWLCWLAAVFATDALIERPVTWRHRTASRRLPAARPANSSVDVGRSDRPFNVSDGGRNKRYRMNFGEDDGDNSDEGYGPSEIRRSPSGNEEREQERKGSEVATSVSSTTSGFVRRSISPIRARVDSTIHQNILPSTTVPRTRRGKGRFG